MSNILDGLNGSQRKAVMTTEGYVRLIAGAGSGKTRTLTHRYAYIADELGISTSNILCVTYTNKAAAEMKKRIRCLIGDSDTGLIGTFHSFCRRMLNEDIHAIGYPSNFMVMDREDEKQMLRQVMEDMKLSLQDHRIKHIMDDIIGPKKGASITYVSLLADTEGTVLERAIEQAGSERDEIFYRYLREQRKCFALDFDDLIYFALYILDISWEIRDKWQQRLQYIMVDEFQDVDNAEYALVRKLSAFHKNLFIVGDPDQTIYTWRGANVANIMEFDKVYPTAVTLMLTENYRSSPQIVAVSNSLIEKNRYRMKKELTATRPTGAIAVYNHTGSEAEESVFIADEIKRHMESGVQPHDIAVLYRAHYLSRSLEEQLLKKKIPYRVYGGVGFYERMEIKDVLSYLRMICTGDDLAFARVINTPRRGFSKTRIGRLREYAKEKKLTMYQALCRCVDEGSPIVERTKAAQFIELISEMRAGFEDISITKLLEKVLTRSGYEQMLRNDGDGERLDNLAELKQSIAAYEKNEGEAMGLYDYLSHVTLMTSGDDPDSTEAVRLMTIHAAKGLEFPVVFVCGLSEGVFPGRRTDTRDKMEEERRLAYVAVTRAENMLYLTDSEGLGLDSNMKYPSRFVFDIEKQLLHYTTELSMELVESSRRMIASDERRLDIRLLDIGTQIDHPTLGTGRIIAIDTSNSCYTVTFSATGAQRSISFTAGFLQNTSA